VLLHRVLQSQSINEHSPDFIRFFVFVNIVLKKNRPFCLFFLFCIVVAHAVVDLQSHLLLKAQKKYILLEPLIQSHFCNIERLYRDPHYLFFTQDKFALNQLEKEVERKMKKNYASRRVQMCSDE
jgi:hypothetical protein